MKQFKSLAFMRRWCENHIDAIAWVIRDGLIYEVYPGGNYKFIAVQQTTKS